jgi:hypothetical protein
MTSKFSSSSKMLSHFWNKLSGITLLSDNVDSRFLQGLERSSSKNRTFNNAVGTHTSILCMTALISLIEYEKL